MSSSRPRPGSTTTALPDAEAGDLTPDLPNVDAAR